MFVQRDFCKYLKNMFELNISKIYAEIKADPTLKDSIPDMTAEELNSDNGKRAVLDHIPEDTLAIFIDKALAGANEAIQNGELPADKFNKVADTLEKDKQE